MNVSFQVSTQLGKENPKEASTVNAKPLIATHHMPGTRADLNKRPPAHQDRLIIGSNQVIVTVEERLVVVPLQECL